VTKLKILHFFILHLYLTVVIFILNIQRYLRIKWINKSEYKRTVTTIYITYINSYRCCACYNGSCRTCELELDVVLWSCLISVFDICNIACFMLHVDQEDGADITANSLHPGVIVTNIFHYSSVLIGNYTTLHYLG